jgi:hypothetical protein
MKLVYSEVMPQVGEQIRQRDYNTIICELHNTHMKTVRSALDENIFPDKNAAIAIYKKELEDTIPFLKDR